VRAILGGLNSVVSGVGSLRTHAGDAHGRERGYRRSPSRIAAPRQVIPQGRSFGSRPGLEHERRYACRTCRRARGSRP
jgi:hypothetical protein